LSLALAGSASADKIVDFGSESFAGVQDSIRNARGGIAFDTSTPFFAANTYEDSPTSGIFFGGVGYQVDGEATVGEVKVQNKGGNYMQVYSNSLQGENGDPVDFAAVTLWKKSDFLNGGDAQQVNLTADDAFSGIFYANPNSNLGTQSILKWVVQVGGIYYVSDETHSLPTDDLTALNSTSISTTQWAPIDWDDDGMFASAGDYGALALQDIQAAGYYVSFTGDRTDDWIQSRSSAFAVDGQVVPEPTSLALLALGAAGAVVRRRRKA
jgi:hypothetical protein